MGTQVKEYNVNAYFYNVTYYRVKILTDDETYYYLGFRNEFLRNSWVCNTRCWMAWAKESQECTFLKSDCDDVFKKLWSASEQNRFCVDCGESLREEFSRLDGGLWADVAFGILICITCAGTHRNFGTHIGFVQSVTLDTKKSWTPDK